MTSPIVSVVMSVFNGERYLREAIESILAQSYRDFELIVIDDGSTDGSGSILDFFEKSEDRVMVYRKDHSGLVEALNHGCSLAQGKYIARMDADDVAVKDRLLWQVEFMEAHQDLGVLGGAVEFIDSAGRSLGTYPNPTEDREIKAALLHRCPLWHPSVMFRKEVFDWAGGYRKIAADAEDYDLWLRVADRFQLANLGKVVLKYRIHPSQVSVSKVGQQALGLLAAQLSASARKSGIPDPLASIDRITSESLAALGVPLARQRDQVAAYKVVWIRNVITAGEIAAAVNATVELLRSDADHMKRNKVADLRLLLAKLYWKQGRFGRSLLTVVHAFAARPVMLARPLKPLLLRLHFLSERKQTISETGY